MLEARLNLKPRAKSGFLPVGEIYSFCRVERNLPGVFQYLWANLHCSKIWHVWEIPKGRTTMVVEAHWKVLNCEYL
jgi:hypothetical protein